MFVSAANGHLEMVKVLDDLGANAETKNKAGIQPVGKAAWEGHDDVVLLLQEIMKVSLTCSLTHSLPHAPHLTSLTRPPHSLRGRRSSTQLRR